MDIATDLRLDPRLRGILEVIPRITLADVASREQLIAEANTPEAIAGREAFRAFQDLCDEAAPSGLEVTTAEFVSQPDGNSVNLQIIRPPSDVPLACVYYIHGGGMATQSCFDGMYRGLGEAHRGQRCGRGHGGFPKLHRGLFCPRGGALSRPDSTTVSPGCTGLPRHAEELNVDRARIVVAGESGGGNLTLATGLRLKRDDDLGLIKGLYALCPYIAGQWPTPECPSSTENEGILLHLHNNRGRIGYGIEAFDERNPLAWPSFAGVDDVVGLPPTVINVNECDPLRDEGINFYRLLLSAGVQARCRQVMGTMHGTEVFAIACPDISADTARDIAGFTRE